MHFDRALRDLVSTKTRPCSNTFAGPPRDFAYRVTGFPPHANYRVTLGFREVYPPCWAVGQRVFSVTANGQAAPLLLNLDV